MTALRGLLKRRDDAVARASAALDADWPARRSPAFLATTERAIAELQAVLQALGSHRGSEVERARTLRNLGAFHADLAPARGDEHLLQAERCLREGLQLIGSEALSAPDATERAKLQFNLANVLREIDREDADRLREALALVRQARAHFSEHATQYVAPCDALLQSVESLLPLAQLSCEVKQRERQAAEVLRSLEQGGDAAAAAQQARQWLQGASSTDLLTRLHSVVDTLTPAQKADSRHAAVRQQLAALGARFAQPGSAAGADQEIVEALRRRYEKDRAADKIDEAREASLLEAMRQIGKMAGDGGEKSLSDMMGAAAGMREFIASWVENAHYLSHGIARPPAGARAAALVEMNWLLRRRLLLTMNRPGKGEAESREALELMTRASIVDKLIYEAGPDDARASVVEAESLRPLAVAVRQFSARAYAMPARPQWGGSALPVNTRTLFHSGAAGTEAALRLTCRRSGLMLPASEAGGAYASTRWRALQQAQAAVFDLRGGGDVERCAVCYELGMALALGRPVVVCVGADQGLPFDIDVKPLELEGPAEADELALADAVDRALCWTWPEPAGQPWLAAVDHALLSGAGTVANAYQEQTARVLRDETTRGDPLACSRALDQWLHFVDDGRTQLLHPHWLPLFPDAAAGQRLFHVMPFRPDWATPVAEAARGACAVRNVRYVRGDEVPQPDVVRSIWEEIARATHVLADLTGLNANVALELGIAHTLGKPVLMVGQSDTADRLFASVRKMRMHSYRVDSLPSTLGHAIVQFLARNG